MISFIADDAHTCARGERDNLPDFFFSRPPLGPSHEPHPTSAPPHRHGSTQKPSRGASRAPSPPRARRSSIARCARSSLAPRRRPDESPYNAPDQQGRGDDARDEGQLPLGGGGGGGELTMSSSSSSYDTEAVRKAKGWCHTCRCERRPVRNDDPSRAPAPPRHSVG